MTNKKVITFTCPSSRVEEATKVTQYLSSVLPVQFLRLENIIDVIPLLSKPDFNTDFIVVDVESLYNIEHVNIFEIISTLSTLIKCTVYREGQGKRPVRRDTKIIAAVNSNTDVNLIKEVIEFQDIWKLAVCKGDSFSLSEIELCVKGWLEDGERIPKIIQELIRNKKKEVKTSKTEISLTPRQYQILDIVSTRGVSNKIIAKMLGISESTVKLHIGAILKKYGVKNRTQLAVFSKKRKVPTEA